MATMPRLATMPRAATWALVIWTVLMGTLALIGLATAAPDPCGYDLGSLAYCVADQGAGSVLGMQTLGRIWGVGMIVLGAVWVATRPTRHGVH
jgi:hypothetical protein